MIIIVALIELQWGQLLTGAGVTGLIGSIILFLLKWKRFNKKDNASVNRENAETEKVKAEAAEIKAKADVTIVDSAFKLIQRLSDECDMTKRQLEKTQIDLDSAIESLRAATSKLNEVQTELNHEREKNKKMAIEIETLTSQINSMKNEKNNGGTGQ